VPPLKQHSNDHTYVIVSALLSIVVQHSAYTSQSTSFNKCVGQRSRADCGLASCSQRPEANALRD